MEHTLSFVNSVIFLLSLVIGVHIVIVWIMAVRSGLKGRSARSTIEDLESSNTPFTTVIIPAWSERGTIERCIESLKSVNYPSWEAIVVAGGPDGTFQAAAEASSGIHNIKVIKQSPKGKNAALNEGLHHSRGEVIVLLDADSQVGPDWLTTLVAPINESCRVTIGNPQPLRKTPISIFEEMERIETWEIQNSVILQGDGSIALHRNLIEQLNGFPEDVLVGVDWDLSARLSTLGVTYTYCPKAEVNTERPATLQEYWINEVRWRRAHLSSLFRLRSIFLGDLKSILTNLYFYLLSWFTVAFSTAAALLLVAGRDQIGSFIAALWIIFIAWIAFRRASLTGEAAAYTGNTSWLKWAWVPPLLLITALLAATIATLTLKQNAAHFKGPRYSRDLKHAR